MKHIYIILVCLVLLSSCAPYGHRSFYFSSTPTDSLKKILDTYTIDTAAAARYDAVYLLSEKKFDHMGGPTHWYFQKHYKLRYIVLKPHEEWLSTFKVSTEEYSYLSDATISILSPGGKTHTYTKSDMHAEKSSDGRETWKLAYADIQVGSLIEENYVIETNTLQDPPLSHNVLLQYSIPAKAGSRSHRR